MTTTTLSPIATRFAWKEYRMLRGFWLAALVIAGLLQLVAVALAPQSSDPVTTIFGIALAAAALYAVGVAATTFSMEHEEETYAYLTGLPTRWFPLFAGKCAFAATSSLLLVAALLITGWLFAGSRSPSAEMTQRLFAGFGFAVVEMLAWGFFFSLLIRQPLLAALLAIGAESLTVTWAANVFGERTTESMTLDSYATVLGPRLAIAACVLAVDVLLARRWLVHERQRHSAEAISSASSPSAVPTVLQLARAALARSAALARHHSPRVFTHLVWQAWRQSWKPMLSMMLIVPGLSLVLVLVAGIWNFSDRIRSRDTILLPYFVALVAMAIYWSVVFYADQRQNKYRFLAEHAVWPRYVWLSRLLVWSLPILLLTAIGMITAIATTFSAIGYFRQELEQSMRHEWWMDSRYMEEQWRGMDMTGRSITFGMWGAIAGAALGQAMSLFFRRALVAGFAALVIAIPLAAWGLAAWTWELNPIIFLAPIAFGFVAATWLRVPDWLVDRNSFVGWSKIAAALALPLVFIAWRLPAARNIGQVEQYEALANLDGTIQVPIRSEFATAPPIHADQIVSRWVTQAAESAPQDNQAIVDRLVRLGEMIDWPLRPGSEIDESGMVMGMGVNSEEYLEQQVAANPKILAEAAPLALNDYRVEVPAGGSHSIQDLIHLLREASRLATRDGKLDVALDYQLAALTLWERLWTGPEMHQLIEERQRAQNGLVQWASAAGQTGARIKRAIAALDKIYPPVTERRLTPTPVDSISNWSPPPQSLATYELLRAIILGDAPARLLGKNANVDAYLAVMTNELPLERQRALTILDFLTIAQFAQWRDVIWRVNQQLLQEWSQHNLLESGEHRIENIGAALRAKLQSAYPISSGRVDDLHWPPGFPPYAWLRTTPFLRMELGMNRNSSWLASVVNTEVTAWGLRQQLALLAYKADQGEYPEFLADLVPEYLPFVPIDPYSGHQFEYRPNGLSLEMRFFRNPSETIPAGTPLLWSVGVNGQQLELTFLTERSDPSDISSDQLVRREVYQLRGDSNWYDPIIFSLPKPPQSLSNDDPSHSEGP